MCREIFYGLFALDRFDAAVVAGGAVLVYGPDFEVAGLALGSCFVDVSQLLGGVNLLELALLGGGVVDLVLCRTFYLVPGQLGFAVFRQGDGQAGLAYLFLLYQYQPENTRKNVKNRKTLSDRKSVV